MKILAKILTVTVLTIILSTMCLIPVYAAGISTTYTLDADFDQGILFNVNHNAPNNDQLQLNEVLNPYPVMWIANAGEDTVSKWNTSTNKEVARYDTWFGSGTHGAWSGAAPSRTAVDAEGNCYVANRHFDGSPADVIKILTNSYIDRNGNGVIDTCTDADNSGAIEPGELAPFELIDNNPANGKIDNAEIKDERIAWVVTVGPNGGLGRSLSIDPDGYIWVGLFNAHQYYKLNPVDGAILTGPINVAPLTPYGSLVDKHGILWGLNYDYDLLRLDTHTNAVSTIPMTMGRCYAIALGYDASGYTQVYMSSDSWNRSYIQYDTNPATNPTNVLKSPAAIWFNSLGIGTDTSGNIYCSNHDNGGGLTKFAPDGSVIWTAPPQTGWSDTRAAVVDSDGNVWVVLLGISQLSKFRGSDGAPLGVFNSGYLPYTYSDATGISLISSVLPQGTWTVTRDSGSTATGWDKVSWTSNEPAGTSVTVRVRSSDDNLSWSGWEDATNGGALSATPNGRYLQVEVLLKITAGSVSPILYDLTIYEKEVGPGPGPSVPSITEWGLIATAIVLTVLILVALKRRLLYFTGR